MFVCFFVIYLRIFNRFHVVTPVLLSICVSLTVFMLWHWCQPADTRHGVSPDTVSPGQDNMWWHPVPADTTCCPGARQSIPNSGMTVTQWHSDEFLENVFILVGGPAHCQNIIYNVFSFSCLYFSGRSCTFMPFNVVFSWVFLPKHYLQCFQFFLPQFFMQIYIWFEPLSFIVLHHVNIDIIFSSEFYVFLSSSASTFTPFAPDPHPPPPMKVYFWPLAIVTNTVEHS